MEELRKAFHAMPAITALRMDRGIVEKNAIAARLQLGANHKVLVRSPIRIVHARRFVLTLIPGAEEVTLFINLPPLGGASMQPGAELRRPPLVESVELHNRGRAQISE